MKSSISLIIFLLSFFLVNSQSDKELLELHKKNLQDLYLTRGAPPEWATTGKVNDDYLSWCIDHYKKPTALLVYTHQNDSLIISLFNQGKTKLKASYYITKQEIVELVDNTNLYLSKSSREKSAKIRGAKPVTSSPHLLKKSYKNINKLIFPTDFKLEEYDHIIIVPTLNISTLPIAAMKINGTYLIDQMSYSIAPSLFELMVSRKVNSKDYYSKKTSYNWENALFVSNPKYPKDSIWDFPNLPGADKEIENITSKISKENFTKYSDKKATKQNILKSICDYDLLYFATHGISNSDNPMENSFLVLAESDDESSYLTLSEIMNIRRDCMLSADLVVLSACQTGLGKSHEGGIIGLARSFQIAGANHVLMSLWNIDDNQTAILMELFFNELYSAKELMPHEALRQAILKYRADINDDPKYWAAFSIFGVPY